MVARNRRPRGAGKSAEDLSAEELRQADDDRETIRVLDISLALALFAFAIIGIFYVAAVLAS